MIAKMLLFSAPLRTEEHLGGAADKSIFAIIHCASATRLHQMPNKDLWEPDIAPEDLEVGRLQRPVLYEMIAPRDHVLPVFACVGIREQFKLRPRDGLPWMAQQGAVQL